MVENTDLDLLSKIQELQSRLEESEQLIEAIKTGEVDAFAINRENKSEIYTLQSADYAYRVLIEEFERRSNKCNRGRADPLYEFLFS